MDPTAIAASWRCPHCRTLQPESFQCWRCARSAVSCSSCHRFRVSVSPDLGYCASDPSRAPLRGDEVEAVRRLAAEGPPEEEVGLTPYATPGFDPGPAVPGGGATGPQPLPMPTLPTLTQSPGGR